MEPKWFRPHDVAEGHEVYVVIRDEVVEGTVTSIGNDGHYVVRTDEGVAMTCVLERTSNAAWSMCSKINRLGV